MVQGEYHIERHLRDEDLGPLYEANNPRLKGHFAILMLRRDQNPALKVMVAVRNDLRKARSLAAMGFLPIEQIADSSGAPGFAWEMLPGETLRERLLRGPLKIGQALALAGVLARTLAEAHGEELIHGDVRPENIFLVQPAAKHAMAGRAVLLRYALHHIRWYARQQRLLLRRNEPLPQGGPFGYAPPELRAGVQKLPDVRSDIYALGLLVHECLGGQVTLDASGASTLSLLKPDPAIGLTPELAATLDVVISGACATDPQGRVQEMAEVLRALRQVARGAGLPWPDEDGRKQVSIVRRLTGHHPVIEAGVPQLPSMVSGPPIPDDLLAAKPRDPSDVLSIEGLGAVVDPTGRTRPQQPIDPTGGARLPAMDGDTPTIPPASRPRGVVPLQAGTSPPARSKAAKDLALEKTLAQPLVLGGAAPAVPPPTPAGDQRSTMALDQVDTGSTVRMPTPLTVAERPLERSGRRDITRLVAALQSGQIDALSAMQAAQEVDDVDLRKGPSWLPTRRDLTAGAIGAVVLVLVLLILGAFRR